MEFLGKLHETVVKYPMTDIWMDSCGEEELEYGLKRGIVGATSNPSIVGAVLKEELPNEMRGRNQSSAVDQAEALTLYAEYAIDFSTQAMRYALMTALSAMLLQRKAEQEKPEKQREGDLI